MPQELTKRVSSQSKGDLLRSTSLLPSSPLGLQNAGIPLGPVGRPNPGLELQLRACDGALGPIRARVRHGSGRLKGAGTRDGNTMEQTHEIHNILHILSYYIYIYIFVFSFNFWLSWHVLARGFGRMDLVRQGRQRTTFSPCAKRKPSCVREAGLELPPHRRPARRC